MGHLRVENSHEFCANSTYFWWILAHLFLVIYMNVQVEVKLALWVIAD